jgi:hypothetical protein
VASTWLVEDKLEAFGWADTEEQAVDAAIVAVRDIRHRGGKPVIAFFRQGDAAHKLKQLNDAKRAARPAPDTSDAHVVEYLYGSWWDGEDGKSLPYRFRITKKTAKRIFYSRSGEQIDDFGEPQWVRDRDNEIGYVNRQKLEADGEVDNRGVHWCQPDSHLYISLQRLLADIRRHEREPGPDLKTLKAEMAAAHPDRGGSNAAFIAARARYVAARRHLHSQQRRSL